LYNGQAILSADQPEMPAHDLQILNSYFNNLVEKTSELPNDLAN
jgi:hypothetical protein